MKKHLCLIATFASLSACAMPQGRWEYTDEGMPNAYNQEQYILAERMRLENAVRMRLGITQAEWASLPPARQLELRMQEAQFAAQGETAYAPVENPALVSATQSIADALRESSRRELYTNAAYGSVVDCEVTGGNAKFTRGLWSTKWAALAPVRFTVAKGDAVTVVTRNANKLKQDGSFHVSYNMSQLEFCADENTGKRYKACRTFPVNDAYRTVYSVPLSIPDAIDGATLNCRYAPGRQ